MGGGGLVSEFMWGIADIPFSLLTLQWRTGVLIQIDAFVAAKQEKTFVLAFWLSRGTYNIYIAG